MEPSHPQTCFKGIREFSPRNILKFYLICRRLVLVHLKDVFNMFLSKGFAIKNENAGDFSHCSIRVLMHFHFLVTKLTI